jgi:hypothetical protein
MTSPCLASQILAYLDTHPHAVDSIDGIAALWLCSTSYDPADVRRVLDELAGQGRVDRINLSNGTVAYGRLASART